MRRLCFGHGGWIIAAMDRPIHAHSDIAQVIDYYQSLATRGSWPRLNQFDPLSSDIPDDIADRMVLVDVKRSPWTFETRYAGAYIEYFAGEHLQGQPFAGRLHGEDRLQVERNLIAAVRKGQPSWRRGRPLIRHELDNVELERVMLPLSRSGDAVDLLLSVTLHHEIKA